MINRKSTSMLFALCIGVLAWPSVAGAVTFVQTSDRLQCIAPAAVIIGQQHD